MGAHKDIRILFKVGGRCFEAVGFLKDQESSVVCVAKLFGKQLKNGGIMGGEDAKFVFEHLSEWPAKLRGYYLITRHQNMYIFHHPDRIFSFSFPFFFDDGGAEDPRSLRRMWGWVKDRLPVHTSLWYKKFLLVRRLP